MKRITRKEAFEAMTTLESFIEQTKDEIENLHRPIEKVKKADTIYFESAKAKKSITLFKEYLVLGVDIWLTGEITVKITNDDERTRWVKLDSNGTIAKIVTDHVRETIL